MVRSEITPGAAAPHTAPHAAPNTAQNTAPNTAVFTIVSRNYLHFALNLMASVQRHMPTAQRFIVLCDSAEGLQPATFNATLIELAALNIEHLDRMVTQYTILELNTAIKPSAFIALFARESADPAFDKLIYFDPDIELYSSGDALLQRLNTADVVLTPHLTQPLADAHHPSDLSIVQSGSYNLGFLALRRSDNTARLLRWWQAKLARDCVVDIPRGLFTDQKWMDLVPGAFERVHIERDLGWNVAYWNLLHRAIEQRDGAYWIGNQPLFFFHFSGYDPRLPTISKHQDRFRLDHCSAAVLGLFAGYVSSLQQHGRERFARLPYAFATLADGTPLPDCARQLIRREIDWTAALPDFRSPAGTRFLIDFLTAPVDAFRPALSRLALQLHRARDDLRAAFPDVLGAHRQAYADWFDACAGVEAGVPPALHPHAARASAPSGSAIAATSLAAPAPSPAAVRPAWGSAVFRTGYRLAYRLAWASRQWLRPLTTLAFRNRLRSALVRRAYAHTVAKPAAPAADAAAGSNRAVPFGITVIGYVHAESGVGESARATLRALACTVIAHAVHDFRAGNASRMGEALPGAAGTAQPLGAPPGQNAAQPYPVSLFHINADQLPLARTLLPEALFAVPHRIGFFAWELERFPQAWWDAFAHLDEVWVPSSFCQQALAAVSPVPVLCLPHAVEVPAVVVPQRPRFGLQPGSVVFLAMADMMSLYERKNPLGAVQAFVDAFGAERPDVELVVKLSNADKHPAGHAALKALAAAHPRIHLIDDYLDRAALNALLDSVDVFVSLHRAEGFGLVIAEAMARGKVVVATGWSGNMDFMSAHNAMPVDYALVPIAQDCGPYRQGERWAEPDLRDAAHKLRQLADNAPLRLALGQRARADCRAQLSPEVVGQMQATRLQRIRVLKGL